VQHKQTTEERYNEVEWQGAENVKTYQPDRRKKKPRETAGKRWEIPKRRLLEQAMKQEGNTECATVEMRKRYKKKVLGGGRR